MAGWWFGSAKKGLSSGKGKGKQTKETKSSGVVLVARNKALSPKDNRISENTVKKQIDRAPDPKGKGRSGYPHKFENIDKISFPRQDNQSGSVSSTTSLYEYPVSRDGKPYNFASKPKDNPGPFRGITSQNKRYKGTVCHNGVERDPNSGKPNPNAGYFHRCKEEK